MPGTPNQVEFTAGDKTCRAEAGSSLLDALRSNGLEVPSLCHLAGLSPYGACRLCLVEVSKAGRSKLTTSCNYPVQAGIQVELDSDRVQRHRRLVLELLLARAPGSVRLRALARSHGVEPGRLEAKSDPDGCILCGLCTRVCAEGARAEAIRLAGRGGDKTLARRFYGEFPDACIGCGACAWVCPTDAISMEGQAVERLRSAWGATRPCRYALLGLAPGSVCENDYLCAKCEVDQRMVDRAGGRHPVFLLLPRSQP